MKATSVVKATISSLVSSDRSVVHLVVDHFAHTWASKQTKAIVLSYTSKNYQIQSSSPDNLEYIDHLIRGSLTKPVHDNVYENLQHFYAILDD